MAAIRAVFRIPLPVDNLSEAEYYLCLKLMLNTPSPHITMNSFWDLCQARFRASLTQQQFSTWIKPLVFDESDTHVHILAPNHFVMDWVREKFSDHIDGWAREHFAQPVLISYALGKKTAVPRAAAAPEVVPAPPVTAQPERRAAAAGMRINASFNFDNFVSGRANQLARAASLQIAENPGQAYNPLFIYGGGAACRSRASRFASRYCPRRSPA